MCMKTLHFNRILAHQSRWLMVSYCDHWMSVMRHKQSLQMTSPKVLAGFFTKLGGNDPYMALFNNCTNGCGPLHI